MSTSTADKMLERSFDKPITIWLVALHLLAIPAFFTFSWANFYAFLGLYFVTACLGITLSYHRLLSHRSFKMPKFWERIFVTFGALAVQGGPLEWVGHHRMHHAHTDTKKDPHNAREGFWHCHWGWLFVQVPLFDEQRFLKKYARDMAADPYYRLLDKMWFLILMQFALGMVLLAIGGWSMIFWGIFLRIIWVYHVTWLVNSLTHFMGYKNYQMDDLSRNNWLVAILAWGEGWHNNHHAHQKLAPAGHRWWEIDVTMMVIRVLQGLGIAYDVNDQLPARNAAELELGGAGAISTANPVGQSI